ncbi:unnamed protein product [Peniophora sp. CBMAI 1063]|nr:unnamed protein product [Peniophora sp. CBMAI 1063]
MHILRRGPDHPHYTTERRRAEVLSSGSEHPPDLEELWNDALDQYRSSLSIDPRDQGLAFVRDLERCTSSDDILDYLQDTSECLSDRRQGSKASRALRKSLKPLIRGLSVILDAGSETASSLGVPGGKGIFAAVAILLQAADRVSATYDDLQKLLNGLEVYVVRLKVRIEAPMRKEAKETVVKALIEVLKTLELATKVMREGRIRHFVKALFTKADGVQSALARLEDVTTEEERMALAHLSGVRCVQPTINRTDVTTRRILGQTTQINARVDVLFNRFQAILESDILTNPRRLEDTSARVNQDLSPVPSHVASQAIESRVHNVSRMGGQLLHVASNFSSENQDIIWRGFAALLSFAVDSEDLVGTAGKSSIVRATTTFSLALGAMEALIRMGCMFVLLFIIWQQSFILRPTSRSPGTVIIVDVLGEVFELQSDTFSTWQNTHDFLLQAFKGRKGLSYVQHRDYALIDSRGTMIEPQKWALSVRPGSKLNMSVIVRDGFARCPYCQHETVTARGSQDADGRINCASKRCGRSYNTLRAAAENLGIREASDTTPCEPDLLEARLAGSQTSRMTEGNKHVSSLNALDGSLASFYRIIVEIREDELAYEESGLGLFTSPLLRPLRNLYQELVRRSKEADYIRTETVGTNRGRA